jgi:prolyl 4-hydroxylase
MTAPAAPSQGGWLLGPLQALVDDPAVTDVLVNGADGVWVDRGRGPERVPLDLGGEPAVRALDEKICGAMGLDPALAEVSQGQYYEITQEFKPHTDYFEAYELGRHSTPTLGQRTWTFMIYLNDVQAGGETAFVNVGLVIPPKQGTAVLWNNLRPDGSGNYDTLHHGTPVTAGYKAIITKWFRKPR